MIRTAVWLFGLLPLLSCGDPPEPTTPKKAFALIGPCIDRVDRQCFFRTLDRDSRWSLCTIHRTLGEIRQVVEASYPEAERASAYGLFKEEATAATPEAMFEIYCKKLKCMEQVARGFGAIQQVHELGPDRVEVVTSRGKAFQMARKDAPSCTS